MQRCRAAASATAPDCWSASSTPPRWSRCDRTPVLRDSLLACDLLLADGQSVVWASRVLGAAAAGAGHRHRPVREPARASPTRRPLGLPARRAAGRARPAGRGHRGRGTPGCGVAGTRDGYFGPDESDAVAAGDPGQRRRHALPGHLLADQGDLPRAVTPTTSACRVLHGVGGSFDVLAGVTRVPRRVAAAGARVGLPPAAGAAAAVAALPAHQLRLRRPRRAWSAHARHPRYTPSGGLTRG